MGSAGSNEWGDSQHLFSPAQVGRDFDFAPNSQLAPLEEFRDYLTIISDTDCRMAEAYRPEEIGGRPRSVDGRVPDAVPSPSRRRVRTSF